LYYKEENKNYPNIVTTIPGLHYMSSLYCGTRNPIRAASWPLDVNINVVVQHIRVTRCSYCGFIGKSIRNTTIFDIPADWTNMSDLFVRGRACALLLI